MMPFTKMTARPIGRAVKKHNIKPTLNRQANSTPETPDRPSGGV